MSYFVEIDHEIFSTVILILLLIQEGLSVTRESMCTKYRSTAWESLPRKSVVRLNDCLDMTIRYVEWDVIPHTKLKDRYVGLL